MSGGVIGHTPNTSVRDRARRLESDAQGDEKVVRPDVVHGAGFGTSRQGINTSGRDAQRFRDFLAEEAKAIAALPSSQIEQYYQAYLLRQAQTKAEEAATEKENRERA